MEAGTLFSSKPGIGDLYLSQSVFSIPLATKICFEVDKLEPTSLSSMVCLSYKGILSFPTTPGIVWCWKAWPITPGSREAR